MRRALDEGRALSLAEILAKMKPDLPGKVIEVVFEDAGAHVPGNFGRYCRGTACRGGRIRRRRHHVEPVSGPRSCSELVNLKFDHRPGHDCGEVVKGN